MRPLVQLHVAVARERFITHVARVHLFAGMLARVHGQTVLFAEEFPAQFARIRFFDVVLVPHVPGQSKLISETFVTNDAHVRPFLFVCVRVHGQFEFTFKRLGTQTARIRRMSRMRPYVHSQLGPVRETFTAKFATIHRRAFGGRTRAPL